MRSEHPSDDDRQRPRGLADALARWDTEQGWMRSTPGREADSTEHVPPPESTPAQFSRPADERRPAPPPMADSWDAVLSRDPQAPRSADPWAPAADSEQEELWTPPGDTVYRRGGPREATLSERGPPKPTPPPPQSQSAPRNRPPPRAWGDLTDRSQRAQSPRPPAGPAGLSPPTGLRGSRATALSVPARQRGRVRRTCPSRRMRTGLSGRRRRRGAGEPSRPAGRMSPPGW